MSYGGVKLIESFLSNDLKRVRVWGTFMGIVMIIYGGIVTYQGLSASIIGGLPGILGIFAGRFIYHSGTHSKRLLRSNDKNVNAVNMILKNIGLFFLIIGILMIIFIVFSALFFLIIWLYK